MSLMALVVGVATAGTPTIVLFDEGDADRHRSRIATILGVDAADVEARRLVDHVGKAPARLDVGRVTPCDVLRSAKEVDEILLKAEGHFNVGERRDASRSGESARKAMECLSEPVEIGVAVDILLLQAQVAHQQQDKHKAGEALRTAFRYQPELTWPDGFPEGLREQFQAASEAAFLFGPSQLTIVPEAPDILIDGHEPNVVDGVVELPIGDHQVQLISDGRTFNVHLEKGAATLRLPWRMSTDVDVGSEASREELGERLSWTFANKDEVWVATRKEVWLHEVGTVDWEERWEPIAAKAKRARSHSTAGWVLTGTGSAAAVAGGVLTALSHKQAMDAYNAGSTAFDAKEFSNASDNYDDSVANLTLSKVLLGIGVAVGGTGFTITRVSRGALQPQLTSSGVQILWTRPL